jgi:leader peptidase (prepilin peptidase) / N-methyltransferase
LDEDLQTLWAVYAFVWGALWGSFLNVVIYRLPRGLSLVRPRSHCPACKTPLRWYDNVPLVSYLVLRGRCRHCEAEFSARYVLVELLTAVLSLLLFLKCADGRLGTAGLGQVLIPYLFYFYFVCAAIAIAFIDIELTVIPDHITLPTAVLGVVAAVLIPKTGPFADLFPRVTWVDSVVGLLVGAGFVLLIIGAYKALTGRVGMGGGDATMLAMVGAYMGWQSLLVVLFLASTQGLLAALVAALVERVAGERGGFLLRGVDHPEYWDVRELGRDGAGPVTVERPPAEEAAAGGAGAPREASADEGDVSFGKTGLPFGPFLALAAVEYLFLGHLVEEWLQLGG